jgi:hypothetical protein
MPSHVLEGLRGAKHGGARRDVAGEIVAPLRARRVADALIPVLLDGSLLHRRSLTWSPPWAVRPPSATERRHRIRRRGILTRMTGYSCVA